MTNRVNFTHPLIFFSLMGIFSFASYRIEQLLGIGAAIIFVIWATTTIYAFNSIKKNQLTYNHPATFFILMITFTLTGYYVQKTLNVETFILVIIWLVVAYFTLVWLKLNPKVDQRLPYLLAIQFVAIAIVMPTLLECANLEQLYGQVMTVTVHGEMLSERQMGISQVLLHAFEKLMVWGSLIIGFYAFQTGRKNKVMLETLT